MQDIDDLLAELVRRVKKLGISIRSLSREAAIGINTLKHMKKTGWSPTPATIRSLQQTILRLEGLSQESLTELAKKNKTYPPLVLSETKNTGRRP